MSFERSVLPKNGLRGGFHMTTRGRHTTHLFFSPTQAMIARGIVNDLNRISHQFVPLLASGATRQQMARALGSAWGVRSVDTVLRRFRAYARALGRKDELSRRLIAP